VIVQGNPNVTPLTIRARGDVNVHGLTFQGCDNRKVRLTPENPTSGLGALLLCAGESADAPLRGVDVTGCHFRDTVTVGLMLQWVHGGLVSGCRWTKDCPDTGEDHMQSGPRVGIFSGGAPCRDVKIIGNEWVGNERDGDWDEGFVFAANVEDWIVQGNTIRDFRLEAVHVTGSAIISGNTFSAPNGPQGCMGVLAWQDIAGAGRSFTIAHNRFRGGGLGAAIMMAAPPAPQFPFSAIIADNFMDGWGIAIGASNADLLYISGNTISNVAQGINLTTGKGGQDCGLVHVTNNPLIRASDCAIYVNSQPRLVRIEGNNLASAKDHLWFYQPENKPATLAKMPTDSNVFLDATGKSTKPVYLWDKRPAFVTDKS
jgi:hypothetical protein